MREDHAVEGAIPAKNSENTTNNQNKSEGKKKNYPPCQYCVKMGHPLFKCLKRLDAKCTKCNQIGHKVVHSKHMNNYLS